MAKYLALWLSGEPPTDFYDGDYLHDILAAFVARELGVEG